MNTKRFLLAVLSVWVVGTAYLFLTCGWLFKWVYELKPVIWRDEAAIMLPLNLIGTNLAGILISIIFVMMFVLLYKSIPGKGVKKGLIYGLIVWLIGPVSGLITLPFYMRIATTVVIYWVISFLVKSLILGVLVSLIYKPKK